MNSYGGGICQVSTTLYNAVLKAELAKRELARRSFADYLAYSHGASWKATKMSTYLANEVQAFLEKKTGNAYDILIIETPPQHGKSMTITESLPAWYMGKHPDQRVIIASYNEEFAERFCRRNKDSYSARICLRSGSAASTGPRSSSWTMAAGDC